MGTTTLQISFGANQYERIQKWRSKVGYPPERSNDSFIKEQITELLNKEVPDVPK
jgi:hypothetical protein